MQTLHGSEETFRKICFWQTLAGSSEVGGIGAIVDGELRRIWLSSSEISAAAHVASGVMLAKITVEAMNEGINPIDLRFYWHTHPGWTTPSPSITDQNAITQQIGGGMRIVNAIFSGAEQWAQEDWLVAPKVRRSRPLEIEWEGCEEIIKQIRGASNAKKVVYTSSALGGPKHIQTYLPSRSGSPWFEDYDDPGGDGDCKLQLAEELHREWGLDEEACIDFVDELDPDMLQWYIDKYVYNIRPGYG